MPFIDINELMDTPSALGPNDNALVFANVDTLAEDNASGADIEEIVNEKDFHSQAFAFPENETEASLRVFYDECHTTDIPEEVSSPTLVDDGRINSSTRTSCCFSDDCHCNVPSNPRSSELAFSFVSCGSEVEGRTLISCSSSLSTEFCHLSGHAGTVSQEMENIYHDHIDSATCISATSDVGSSKIGEPVSFDGTSTNARELDFNCYLLDDLTSSFEIDYSMEHIDLSDKGKLKETCMAVDNKLLFPVSCRTRRHISYKKIIQDALTSRKRLTKEYEQLGVLYGDIYVECIQHPEQNPLSIAGASLESKRSTTKDSCESEWELL